MKSIIIYFSRADDNYYVGYVNKGNTEVIAEYIKDITNSDMFKVERKKSLSKRLSRMHKSSARRTNK